MSDTPIIDAACEALAGTGWVIWSEEVKDRARDDACVILRAALPWDLPAERLEAMAEEYYNGEAVYEDMTAALQEIYRAQPIMRELYPEQFR
jgi:hypothetical protein